MASRKNSDYDPVERRMRAAILLAGVDFPELAARINEPSYKVTTLRKLNADSPATKTKAAFRRAAEVLDLPVTFFTAPLPELGPNSSAPDDGLRETVRRLEDDLREVQLRLVALEAEAPEQTAASSTPTERPQQGPQP